MELRMDHPIVAIPPARTTCRPDAAHAAGHFCNRADGERTRLVGEGSHRHTSFGGWGPKLG